LKRILIVEDERILAVSLRMDLEEIGYSDISLATSCDDAMAVIKIEKIDLILMDINISGEKTGIDTAGLISEISRVPIVYLTGETDIETRTKAEAIPNCRGYLTKPVDMNLLEPILSQVFSLSLAE
jgi:DNA-binding response OmpR family regulator